MPDISKITALDGTTYNLKDPSAREDVSHIAPIVFSVTLAVNNWSNGTQTVSNANFLSSGYVYIVTPARTSIEDYSTSKVSADDVVTTGSMTFYCDTTPISALTVNVLRLGVLS